MALRWLVLSYDTYRCFVSFVFFKQKTAYEMRISDWSSDVCSSDLPRDLVADAARRLDPALVPAPDQPLAPLPADEIVERGRGRAREPPQRIAVEIDTATGPHEAVAEPPQRIGGPWPARLVHRPQNTPCTTRHRSGVHPPRDD